MGSGSSHPSDFKRWADFLIQVHRDQSPLDGATLRRWLMEIERWPADTAYDLVDEYEFSRDLLNAYDECS